METDRELLEMAANAAGYAFRAEITNIGMDAFYVDGHRWNPIKNDCDALRMAVKLSLLTAHYELFLKFLHEEFDFDLKPSKATRRAIVRAAAEIGRNMK